MEWKNRMNTGTEKVSSYFAWNLEEKSFKQMAVGNKQVSLFKYLQNDAKSKWVRRYKEEKPVYTD